MDPKEIKLIQINKENIFDHTSGFGSHNNEQIDNKTFEIVNAGDQLLRSMSRQIDPLALIFG